MKHTKTILAFGQHLRDLRLKHQLTQIDLAVAADMDRSTIQRIEGGQINPSLDLLVRLALALGLPLKELMDIGIKEQ